MRWASSLEAMRLRLADFGRSGRAPGPIPPKQSGLWIANVKTGQRVEKGQILGEIWDCFGTILEEVVSRVDGWVLSVTTSMAVGAQARDDGDDWFRRTVTIAENRASPDVRPTAALL